MVDCDLFAEGFERLHSGMLSGVYALLRAGKVIYVGQSLSVYQRLAHHHNARLRGGRRLKIRMRGLVSCDLTPRDSRIYAIPFDEILVRWCEPTRLDALERELILRLRPEYNRRFAPVTANAPVFNISLDEIGLGHLQRERPLPRRRIA